LKLERKGKISSTSKKIHWFSSKILCTRQNDSREYNVSYKIICTSLQRYQEWSKTCPGCDHVGPHPEITTSLILSNKPNLVHNHNSLTLARGLVKHLRRLGRQEKTLGALPRYSAHDKMIEFYSTQCFQLFLMLAETINIKYTLGIY